MFTIKRLHYICICNFEVGVALFILFSDVIMVGSFSGILRAYSPTNEPFSPSHLLLEMQLPSPIIQVGVVKLLR